MIDRRDRMAMQHLDLYIGVGSESRRCHEEAFHQIEGTQDWILVYSQENYLKPGKHAYAALFRDHQLLPIPPEYLKYIGEATKEVSPIKKRSIDQATPIKEPIQMRFTPEEMQKVILTHIFHLAKRRRFLYGMSAMQLPRSLFLEMGATIWLVWTWLFGERLLSRGFLLGSQQYGSKTAMTCYFILSVVLLILHGLTSRNERKLPIALAVGTMPLSLWTFFLFGLDSPLNLAVALAVLLFCSLIAFWTNMRKEYGIWYSMEQARNLFVVVSLPVSLVMFILDMSNGPFHLG